MTDLLAYLRNFVAVGALALAALLAVALTDARLQLARLRAEHAEAISAINVACASFAIAMRATEQEWAARVEKEAHDGQNRIDTAQRDAAAARAAAGSLRAAADRYRAAATAAAHPCPAAVGPPASAAIELFADLFARADERAGELAQAADLAHAAGITCERAYDALRASPPQE